MLSATSIQETIDSFGQQIVGVFADPASMTPPFAYTIGLSPKIGHELLVVGLPMAYARSLLSAIASEWNTSFLGVPMVRFTNLPLLMRRCDTQLRRLHDEFVIHADEFFGMEVDVVQVIYSDPAGHTPMSAYYDHTYMASRQPLFVRFPPRPGWDLGQRSTALRASPRGRRARQRAWSAARPDRPTG